MREKLTHEMLFRDLQLYIKDFLGDRHPKTTNRLINFAGLSINNIVIKIAQYPS